jgi:hypothetical protein
VKNLLLEILLTTAVTGFVAWRWAALIPRVLAAVQPVAAAVFERRREMEELQEEVTR